ncbi:MAG: transcriptional regulator [Desulfurococcaceae archaeon]|nr:transcriptional regulator [Desulfurococcaceae archaeon]
MDRDRVVGLGLLVGSIAVAVVYTWLTLLTEYWKIVIQLTAVVAVVGVCAIVGWIGYTLATTPPPKPIEEIEREIEEELRRLEQESRSAGQPQGSPGA